MNLMPTHLSNLSQLMNAAELRHRVISQNLANVNTPNYQRLDVEFESLLAEQMNTGASGVSRGEAVKPRVIEEQGLAVRADGNNVDVDREIGQLNKNAILFQTYSQLLSSQFDAMRRAIR